MVALYAIHQQLDPLMRSKWQHCMQYINNWIHWWEANGSIVCNTSTIGSIDEKQMVALYAIHQQLDPLMRSAF